MSVSISTFLLCIQKCFIYVRSWLWKTWNIRGFKCPKFDHLKFYLIKKIMWLIPFLLDWSPDAGQHISQGLRQLSVFISKLAVNVVTFWRAINNFYAKSCVFNGPIKHHHSISDLNEKTDFGLSSTDCIWILSTFHLF